MPLHLSTTDIQGGAARATYRLHTALRGIGIESRMLVQFKYGTDPHVVGASSPVGRFVPRVRSRLDTLALRQYDLRPGAGFSPARVPERVAAAVRRLAPDLVHLHWVSGGGLRPETLRQFGVPVVWTLHDMWPFTGGCHYDGGCGRYQASCGCCPILNSADEHDLSRRVWLRKRTSWADVELTLVTPSRWLAECARASSLFRGQRIEVIPYGLDLSVFRPDREHARERLGLEPEQRVILFGAMHATEDMRKGFDLALDALVRLARALPNKRLVLMVFGGVAPTQVEQLGFECRFTGSIHNDAALAEMYSAADVFVAPSRQDNLPNTVLEAAACGTPSVAFRVGGIPDIVVHHETGYLADPFDIDDLANGIKWVLVDRARWATLSWNARRKAERDYDPAINARRHQALYSEVLAGHRE